MFNNIPAFDLNAFTATIEKIVALNTATITKAAETQQAAARSLLTLSQERAKAALEIKDPEGYITFVTEQAEIARSTIEELLKNSQAATRDAEAYFAEIQAILSESQEAAAKAASASKSATQKAPAKKAA